MDREKKEPFENPTRDDESDMPAHGEDRLVGEDTERALDQFLGGIES